jgi:hypothetical protein
MKTVTLTGPVWWASYLVNGDDSSLLPEDKAKADAWRKRERVNILAVEGEPWFTWFLFVHAPEAGCTGGTVVEYVCTPTGIHE